jgi:hypothetical protein
LLGLPPVRAVRDGVKSRKLECCSYWPQAVRPPSYYARIQTSVRFCHWSRSTRWPRDLPQSSLGTASAANKAEGSPCDPRPVRIRWRTLRGARRTITGSHRSGFRTRPYRSRSPIRAGWSLKAPCANALPRRRDLRPGSAGSRHRRR